MESPTPDKHSPDPKAGWDADLYEGKHSFVWRHGADLIELLEMVHARRPWARVTIYDEEGRILRRVKPRPRPFDVASD